VGEAQALWIDLCMDIQLGMLVAMSLILVACGGALVAVGALVLILDMAMAMLGAAIYIAQLDPQQSCVHVIPCMMNMIMRVIIIANPFKAHKSTDFKPWLTLALKIAILACLPTAFATGTETPKVTLYEYFLPGVTRWDGIPYHDFRRIWWIALCAALGNVSQEGWSLLQTARDQDLGAAGNPGTAGQAVQSANRNQRLFGAILNYIEATSYIYRYATANFANNGRGLFNYLYEYGHLPYTSEQRTKLENEWTDATMATVGIKFTADAVFRWAEYIDNLAGKLNKSERDKRVKYLAGFPASFDVLVVAERSRGAVGSYTHPANYPAHHPNAGNAHPHAGQPDIMATAHGFYSEWARMIDKGMIKAVPKGMAYQADHSRSSSYGRARSKSSASYPASSRDHGYRSTHSDGSSDDDEHANMARARVTKRMVCGVCGGIGHPGRVDGVGSCLTALLGHRVDHADLSRMTYPDGYNPPRFLHKPKPSGSGSRDHPHSRGKFTPRDRRHARAAEREDDSHDSHDSDDETAAQSSRVHFRSHKHKGNYRRPQAKPRRVRKADDESDYQAPPSMETTQNSDRDAESNESDHDEHSRLAVAFDNIQFE
jgi:hypothetical protein